MIQNDLEVDLNKSKQINIDNNSTLVNTIINNNVQHQENSLSDNKNIKTISVNENNNSNNINTETETKIETIELDKLLSGEIKKVEIIHKNEDLNTMSIKQLKELAKANNIKISGNKKDLITALSDIKQQVSSK